MKLTIIDTDKLKETLKEEIKEPEEEIKIWKIIMKCTNTKSKYIPDVTHVMAIIKYDLLLDHLKMDKLEKVPESELYFSKDWLLWKKCNYGKEYFDQAVKIFEVMGRGEFDVYLAKDEDYPMVITDETLAIMIAPRIWNDTEDIPEVLQYLKLKGIKKEEGGK